jgi:hypothetical protein
MSFQRTLRAKPGFFINEVAHNPKPWNCWIEVRDGQEIIDMMPATDRLLRHPNLQPPPEVFIPEEMRTLEGIIPIEISVPDYNLCIHLPPFHQVIYGIVADAGELLFETVFSALTKSYQVLPNTPQAKMVARNMVETMNNRAYLVHYKDEHNQTWYKKAKRMIAEDYYLIVFKKGYDPIAAQIMDFIKGWNMVDYGKLEDFVMHQIGWLQDPQALEGYIKCLEKGQLWGARVCGVSHEGNIQRVPDSNWIRFLHPLEPWPITNYDA